MPMRALVKFAPDRAMSSAGGRRARTRARQGSDRRCGRCDLRYRPDGDRGRSRHQGAAHPGSRSFRNDPRHRVRRQHAAAPSATGSPSRPTPICAANCEYCRREEYNRCPYRLGIGTTVDGGLADQLVMPALAVHKLPDNVSLAAGALTEPLAVSVHAVIEQSPVAGRRGRGGDRPRRDRPAVRPGGPGGRGDGRYGRAAVRHAEQLRWPGGSASTTPSTPRQRTSRQSSSR